MRKSQKRKLREFGKSMKKWRKKYGKISKIKFPRKYSNTSVSIKLLEMRKNRASQRTQRIQSFESGNAELLLNLPQRDSKGPAKTA